MTRTKVSESLDQREVEKRESRLKQTQQFILSNSIAGLLNNHKWYSLFEWIECENIPFGIKILLSGEYRKCDWIRELEDTAILIDDKGDFIEFFEIESLQTVNHNGLSEFLRVSNFDYNETQEGIEVYGYKR